MPKQRIRLTESQLRNIVRRCINEAVCDTPYGRVSTNKMRPTFDDEQTQASLKQDTIDMLSSLPTERFLKYYEKRMSYDDPDTVDAIYHEYQKRKQRGEL